MEKYGGLPGIDTESQDIFETSDIESEAELEHEPEPTEIEALVTDPQAIRNRYANDVIDGLSGVDFLGSITNPVLGSTGYAVRRVDETRDQKLARIARELQELADPEKVPEPAKLAHIGAAASTSGPIDPEKLVALLETAVSSNNPSNPYQSQLNELFAKVDAKINEKPVAGKAIVANSPSETLELESRINSLEQQVGEVAPGSIQNLLNDLARKIKIIHNPDYPIDRVRKEVTQLAEETEKLASDRKLLEVSELLHTKEQEPSEKKIDELYRVLPEFEQSNKSIPQIIKRLKSLNTVHADIAHSIQLVGDLDRTLADMDEEIQSWNESIDVLNGNLKAYSKNFEENKTVMENKIEELSKRLGKVE
ncbi:uncharacterized protein CANTADRAFT_7077 [Suhomyces tanzawaensis NRRL Y-17324]|uniref:Dynactin subunit n=1 Tax=Suhomyces tanzawaensis NRRL Y-17324 TaxID=984487 RepID=A0A1E4SGU0_9ASCO|nr:uncharacterized protein CANTADRAFT_7077 [Suhomyces tanzawaensis NRRL Y-17324]ODV78729.1 hypothetical protein CANTADRAFT_7077 [Suhomyces tanzawaensis NRRL Y-17324]